MDFSQRQTSTRDRLQREKDFSNNLSGTLFVQNDSVIVIDKNVVLRIVTIFCVSYLEFSVKYVHQMETRNTSTLLQEYYKETH